MRRAALSGNSDNSRVLGNGAGALGSVSEVKPSRGGLWVVFRKELADHLTSTRFIIVFLLVAVAGLASVYVAGQGMRQSVGEAGSQFVFLRLFTVSGSSLPSFVSFVSFLGPLVGLALGFDAINGERSRGTLSRLLAQPIYRDDVVNGKFLAGLAVLALMLLALGLLVAGLGLVFAGVPPSLEEVLRIVSYLVVSVVYVAFWLALSLLFSILFRQTATSALAGIAVWLFLAIFAGLLAGVVADAVHPLANDAVPQEVLANAQLQMGLSRLSPTTLYDEATITILSPGVRTINPIFEEQLQGAIPGPLPLGQSLLLVWPHLVGLVAATMICFALAYVVFMRQEVRAG